MFVVETSFMTLYEPIIIIDTMSSITQKYNLKYNFVTTGQMLPQMVWRSITEGTSSFHSWTI
jgi:hypothetical protein